MTLFRYHSVTIALLASFALAPNGVSAQTIDEALKLGRAAMLEGRWDDAVRLYGQALATDAKSPAVHAGQILSLLKANRVHDAEVAAQIGREAAPTSAIVAEAHGEVLFRQGKPEQAGAEFQRALGLDANLARAYWGLAQFHDSAWMFKTARAEVEKAHALDPDDPDVLLTWAHLQEHAADEVPALQRYLATRSNDKPERRAALQQHIELVRALSDRKIAVLASPYKPTQLRLFKLRSQTRSGAYVAGWAIELSINGGKPQKLLLDTGAHGILLNRSVAANNGVTFLAKGRLQGIGERKDTEFWFGLAERVQIGAVELRNYVVQVLDRRSVAEDAGIVGTDVLQHFRITIDVNKWTMSLQPFDTGDGKPPDFDEPHDRTTPADEGGFVPVYHLGHLLLVPTQANKVETLFAIDTGAYDNLISTEVARKSAKLVREAISVGGIAGSVNEVYSVPQLVLEFANFRLTDRNVVAFDLFNRNTDMEIGGLMGRPMLSNFKLSIDYRNGLVGFDYQPPQ